MTVLRRSRRLAQARGAAILTRSHVAAGWGYNGEGQLGDGTITSRSGYGDIRVGDDVEQAAAGSGHGLALRSDGTVWAWGLNGAGELGDGTTTSRSTPVQVTGLTGVTQVAASGAFSLALRSDGTVSAWGGNRRGQLGNSTTAGSPVPVQVAGLSHVTGISAGYDSSMATRTSGISAITSVWTWGGNDVGQLGDGTLTSHSTPERVTGLPVYIAGISAGGRFTARLGDSGISATGGFATVLGTDGTVWAWGDDSAGQLGNAPSSTPVTRPVNTIGAGSRITQLSAGDFHMLALKSNGTALAWGANGSGQLGNGTTTTPPARYRSPAWPTPRRWPQANDSASRSTPCRISWGHSRAALARLPAARGLRHRDDPCPQRLRKLRDARQVAELAVYLRGPGAVVRCRRCDSVLMVFVTMHDRTCVDLLGLAALG
jgi:alpha-tubulin suppressor-like RCC1 family protein